jgi:hypothetical protein
VPGFIYFFDNYTGKRKETIFAELGEMRAHRSELEKEMAQITE